MSAGCYQGWSGTTLVAASNIPIVVYSAPAEDEQVVLETCRGCKFVTNWEQKVHLVDPTILI
jgi:hypothetical protein